jgi:hypothetical protein
MKYLFILSLFFATIGCKTTTSLFKKVDYSSYISRRVEELIKVYPLNKTPISIRHYSEPVGSLAYTKLVYTQAISIRIYLDVNHLEYVTRYNRTGEWDFNLIKKEKIKRLEVFYEDEEVYFYKDNVIRYPHPKSRN